MSPRFVLGRENVPCVAQVVNRSLKADCTDFSQLFPNTMCKVLTFKSVCNDDKMILIESEQYFKHDRSLSIQIVSMAPE